MATENYDMSPNEFKQYVLNFFAFVFRCIHFLLAVARKKMLLLFCVALGAMLSLYFTFNRANKKYEYRMSCIYNDNQARIFGEMLEQLDLLVQNKSYASLSTILSIPVEKVPSIVSIKGKTLGMGKLEEDYSNNKTPFYIEVELMDTTLVPVLEKQVLSYLNSNELSVRSLYRQHSKWADRIAFYNQQMAKLDSLKDVIRISYLNGNHNIEMAQQNNSVVDIYKLSDSMSYNLSDFKYYIDHYESVQKVYGFRLITLYSISSIYKKIALYTIFIVIVFWLGFSLLQLIRNSQISS